MRTKFLFPPLVFILCSCGAGDRSIIENTTNINCNTNIITEIVPPSRLSEKMASLEDAGADVLRYDELPSGDVTITYSIEQCNGNGNIDQSETGDTSIEN
jgi:hypothetical protein